MRVDLCLSNGRDKQAQYIQLGDGMQQQCNMNMDFPKG